MHHIDRVFNQPVLYQGIHISCRSIFGYHYRIKNAEDHSFTSVEFLQEFVKQINQAIRRNAIMLRVMDILTVIILLVLSGLCLTFSPSFLDQQIPYLIFVILVVFVGISFIYLKFKNISCLNKRIEIFLDEKKEDLTRLGLKSICIKSKLYDRAPDVFLNLLPAKSALGLKNSDSESLQMKEDLENEEENLKTKNNIFQKESRKDVIINIFEQDNFPEKTEKCSYQQSGVDSSHLENIADEIDEGEIKITIGDKVIMKPSRKKKR